MRRRPSNRPHALVRPSKRLGLLVTLLLVLGGSSRSLRSGAVAFAQVPEPEPAPESSNIPEPAAPASTDEGTSSGCGCHRTVLPEAYVPPPPPPEPVPVASADSDGDGIVDAEDRCPRDAEDKDGFQDQDGCPDPDNDADGIADVSDQCPNEPGTIEGHGCPTFVAAQPRVETPTETKRAEPQTEREPPKVKTEARPAVTEPRAAAADRSAMRVMASGEQLRWVIAVMDVQAPNDPTMKKGTLRGLSDQTRVLLAVRKLKVVDRGQQEAAMKQVMTDEKKKSYAACVDTSCQIPLGKVLAATHILRLTISRFGDTCTTNGELIDLASEVSSGAATTRSACKEMDLLDSVERVADELITSARN